MKEDNDILKQIGHRDGMSVPEGYFADFAARMAADLPKTEFEESDQKAPVMIDRTLWQKVRPYVYMAAMFAGVWCMMNLLSNLTAKTDPGPSPILAEALDNEIFVYDYILDDLDDRELMDQMIEDGFDLTSLDMSDSAEDALAEQSQSETYSNL